jgi:16S rRNA (guanine527-N7)-methyltransferase
VKLALLHVQAGAAALGHDLSADTLRLVERYIREILAWGTRLNLTAADTPEAVAGHILDSLSALTVFPIPPAARLVDVGSGAGFPGVPVKIVRPDLALTLIDASRRRVAFLEHLRTALDFADVEVMWGRAEDLAHRAGLRETFRCAVERATARVATAAELCLPFVEVGGAAILLKGPRAPDETHDAMHLLESLGSGEAALHIVLVAGRRRVVVVLPKRRASPPRFPRKPSHLGRNLGGREPR